MSDYFTETPVPAIHIDDRQIHVANAGSNTGSYGDPVGGGTRGDENNPFQTIAYALGFARNNFGDRLYLKKGDTFTGSLFPNSLSGFGPTREFMVLAYGTGARPIIDTTTTPFYQNSFHTTPQNIRFQGLELTSSTYTGLLAEQQKAIMCTWQMANVLVEDCYIHNYGFGIDFEAHDPGGIPDPMHVDMSVRGCVIADIYVNSLATQSCSGIFAAGVTNLYIQGNVFINCAWTQAGIAFASTFKHAMYVHAGFLAGDPGTGCANVFVQDNICLNADGFTVRAGGTITGNLVWNAMSGIQVGMGDTAQDGGITFNLNDNVVGGLQDFDGAHATIGFAFGNVGNASTFLRNIVARAARDPQVFDVRALWFRHPDFEADGVTPCARNVAADLSIRDNILYHGGYVAVPDPAANYSGTTDWKDNDLQLDDIETGTSDTDSMRWDQAGVIATMTGSGNNVFQTGVHEADLNWYERAGVTGQDITLWASDIGDASATFIETSYLDPERTTTTYATALGLADLAALEAALRQRSYDNWNVGLSRDALTANAMCAYIRAGFA